METRSSYRWWILVVLCLSSLVLVVDGMALTVAVPQMTRDIGATAQDTQWILDSYVLVFAGLLLTSGSLGDRFGRRKVMICGLLLFGAASLAAVFAANPGELIAVRVAMGVGGALIMPSTLSILIVVFDEEERRKAMAAWTSVAMLGLVGSPVLGGILIDHFSWHAIFFINIPVVVLAILAALFLMPESKGPWQKPDLPGAVLSAAGMVALVWWIIGIPQHGAFGGTSLIPLAVAVAALSGFVYWENVTSEPMVPLVLFKNRNFSGGSLSLALVEIANGGLLLVFTQYLQFVLGYSPVKAGLAFVPLAIGALVGNAGGAKAGATIGPRFLVLGGMLVMAASFGLLTMVSATTGFAIPAIALGLLGLGAGVAMPGRGRRADEHDPAGQGGRRLGPERHHPAGRVRPRHRDPRLAAGRRLHPPHAGRRPRAGQALDHRRARHRARRRRAGPRRPRGLHRRDVDHLHRQRDRRPGRRHPGHPGHPQHQARRPGRHPEPSSPSSSPDPAL